MTVVMARCAHDVVPNMISNLENAVVDKEQMDLFASFVLLGPGLRAWHLHTALV